jgi:hypothetical protein
MCSCRKRTLLMLGVLSISAVAVLFWPRNKGEPARASTADTGRMATQPVPDESTVVYYFHGTVRCHDCLEIERVSREAVGSVFSNDMAAGRMVWQSVDYDLPPDAHFLHDFALQCPSLAIEKRVNGVPGKRIVLTNTWEKVRVPSDLQDYVVSSLLSFLDER